MTTTIEQAARVIAREMDLDETDPRVFAQALSAARLLAADWRPISEAPRDGTWIIALTSHGVVPVVWGVSWNNQHWENGCVVYQPTHYMPLPSPPEEGTK